MVSLTIELNDQLAQNIKRIAESQHRTLEELVVDAVSVFASNSSRPMPQGIGEYRSGQSDVSSDARDILREAARSGEWP